MEVLARTVADDLSAGVPVALGFENVLCSFQLVLSPTA